MDFSNSHLNLIDGSDSFSLKTEPGLLLDSGQKYTSDTDGEISQKIFENLLKHEHLDPMKSLTHVTDSGKGPTSITPNLDDYNGCLSFELHACSVEREKSKSKWVCSNKLRKIFTQTDCVVSLRFTWNNLLVDSQFQLFIRAVPIYTSPDFSKVVVKRCPVHSIPNHPSNRDFNPEYVDHVLRCENSEAIYEKDEKSGRLSVKVPAHMDDSMLSESEESIDKVKGGTILHYKFVCQTSCASGMDRRPIFIIFTLENADGEVYGRRTWAFKICSCPKRDMKKEELDLDVCGSPIQETSEKKLLIKNHAEEVKPTGLAERLDQCFYESLEVLPKNTLLELRSALAGRYFHFKDHTDPKVQKTLKKLI